MGLKWLHLSDLHLIYNNYETKIMRNNFLKYLEENFKGKLDILFITGDITHQGSDYSSIIYDFLEGVITAIDVKKEMVFVVPGNHDIKRSGIISNLIKGLLSENNARESINQLDQETYNALLKGQEDYREFYKVFLGREIPDDNIHFIIKNKDFNVIHINTCLIAGGNNVEGRILVGLDKLYDALETLEENDNIINFAIGHHTIDCIHEDERQSFLNRLSDSKIDVYLNGHVHRANYFLEANNYNNVFMFTAGSNVVDGYADSIFISGEVDTKTGEGNVTYHTWNKVGEYWHIDSSIGRQTANGSYHFKVDKFYSSNSGINLDDYTLEVDENDFKSFLIDFHNVIVSEGEASENFIPKDVSEKFINMACSITLRKQFDKFSALFPVVNSIFYSSIYVGFEKKYLVPNLILTEYMEQLYKNKNGDLIYQQMVKNLTNEYKNKVHYSEERLRLYLSILIFWSIHECDIFNEDKRVKEETIK